MISIQSVSLLHEILHFHHCVPDAMQYAVADSECSKGKGEKKINKGTSCIWGGGHQSAESFDIFILKRGLFITFCPLSDHFP